MFDRLKKAFQANPAAPLADEFLTPWASGRMLSCHALAEGGWVLEGRVLDRPFKAGCAASSRSYIRGMELMARFELGLLHDVHVVVMNRELKRTLENQSVALFTQVTESVQTTDKPLPEELGWVSMHRDAGWPGPPPAFWARYAVLTSMPESARQWLDAEAVERLLQMPEPVREDTPLLLALTRGKTYVRMQIDAPGDRSTAVYALDLFEHLSARALALFPG